MTLDMEIQVIGEKVEYYDVNLHLFYVLKHDFPESLKEAEDISDKFLSLLSFGTYEARLLARDMFINGYMLGKHAEKIK